MNIFKEIRERVNILEVCDVLRIKLNRNYKAICPFADHNEKTASFSISPSKNIFCCFGCGKKGDSITLVQELLRISPLESAKYINYHLNLGIDTNQKATHIEINQYKIKRDIEEKFKQWENNTFQLLCDYLHLMWHWEDEKAPKSPDDEIDKLYVEAMHNKDYIEYVIGDIFINGTNKDKIWFWKTQKEEVSRIESRINTFRAINK